MPCSLLWSRDHNSAALNGEETVTESDAPIAEGAALHLVFLLAAPSPCLNLAPNGGVPELRLKDFFVLRGDWELADYEPGAQYAQSQGWIKRAGGRIQLTETGHEIGMKAGS